MKKQTLSSYGLLLTLFCTLLLLGACVRPAPESENFLAATATPGVPSNLTTPAFDATPLPIIPAPGQASPTPTPGQSGGESAIPPEAAATPVPAAPESPPAGSSSDTTTASGETIHVVQAGDNLFRIGLRYGFTAQELATYNGIPNMHLIYVGQQIRIPPRP